MSLNFFKIEKVDYAHLKNQRVSVVLPTFRKNPKFEMLYKCLSHQTIKPFELIITDCLYEMHKDYIEMLSEKYKIPTIHIPRNNPDNALGLNMGVVNSSGDYIFFINDCTYYPHKWIEKHLNVCTHNFLSLGSRYFTYKMDFEIEKYCNGQIEIPSAKDDAVSKQINELSHGIKDYLNIYFDKHQVTSPQDNRLLGLPADILTSDNIIIEALPGWCYGGNIAAPTEMLLDINGFDEEYDKGYGWIDCDLSIRIFNKGYKIFMTPSNWFLEIQDKEHESVYNVQPEMNKKTKTDHNWKLYEQACEQRKTWANPNKNLREEHEKTEKKGGIYYKKL